MLRLGVDGSFDHPHFTVVLPDLSEVTVCLWRKI